MALLVDRTIAPLTAFARHTAEPLTTMRSRRLAFATARQRSAPNSSPIAARVAEPTPAPEETDTQVASIQEARGITVLCFLRELRDDSSRGSQRAPKAHAPNCHMLAYPCLTERAFCTEFRHPHVINLRSSRFPMSAIVVRRIFANRSPRLFSPIGNSDSWPELPAELKSASDRNMATTS